MTAKPKPGTTTGLMSERSGTAEGGHAIAVNAGGHRDDGLPGPGRIGPDRFDVGLRRARRGGGPVPEVLALRRRDQQRHPSHGTERQFPFLHPIVVDERKGLEKWIGGERIVGEYRGVVREVRVGRDVRIVVDRKGRDGVLQPLERVCGPVDLVGGLFVHFIRQAGQLFVECRLEVAIVRDVVERADGQQRQPDQRADRDQQHVVNSYALAFAHERQLEERPAEKRERQERGQEEQRRERDRVTIGQTTFVRRPVRPAPSLRRPGLPGAAFSPSARSTAG